MREQAHQEEYRPAFHATLFLGSYMTKLTIFSGFPNSLIPHLPLFFSKNLHSPIPRQLPRSTHKISQIFVQSHPKSAKILQFPASFPSPLFNSLPCFSIHFPCKILRRKFATFLLTSHFPQAIMEITNYL